MWEEIVCKQRSRVSMCDSDRNVRLWLYALQSETSLALLLDRTRPQKFLLSSMKVISNIFFASLDSMWVIQADSLSCNYVQDSKTSFLPVRSAWRLLTRIFNCALHSSSHLRGTSPYFAIHSSLLSKGARIDCIGSIASLQQQLFGPYHWNSAVVQSLEPWISE